MLTRSQELLGHVGPATLVDHIRDDKKHLERDHEEEEEAHAGGGCGDHWKEVSISIRAMRIHENIPFNR